VRAHELTGTTNILRDRVKGIIELHGGRNGCTRIDQTTYPETR
jgi:hypothetical protein